MLDSMEQHSRPNTPHRCFHLACKFQRYGENMGHRTLRACQVEAVFAKKSCSSSVRLTVLRMCSWRFRRTWGGLNPSPEFGAKKDHFGLSWGPRDFSPRHEAKQRRTSGDKTNLIVIMLAKFVTCILLSGASALSSSRNAPQITRPQILRTRGFSCSNAIGLWGGLRVFGGCSRVASLASSILGLASGSLQSAPGSTHLPSPSNLEIPSNATRTWITPTTPMPQRPRRELQGFTQGVVSLEDHGHQPFKVPSASGQRTSLLASFGVWLGMTALWTARGAPGRGNHAYSEHLEKVNSYTTDFSSELCFTCPGPGNHFEDGP